MGGFYCNRMGYALDFLLSSYTFREYDGDGKSLHASTKNYTCPNSQTMSLQKRLRSCVNTNEM